MYNHPTAMLDASQCRVPVNIDGCVTVLYTAEVTTEYGSHLKPAVELIDRVSEVDALPLGQELPQLGAVLQAEVVAHEVPVDAVPAPLLRVVQDVRG
jgi:hypothetical protein